MKTAVVMALAGTLGCATSSFLSYRMAPDYPRTDRRRTLTLDGLEAPVEVLHDSFGVPHIRAATERDLMRAVGFVHGRDRFFQMDLLRRLAAGRVAELVGEEPFLGGTTVTFDLAMRAWGLEEAARRDADGLDGRGRDLLEAYADGVNAAVRRWLPLEYRLLRVDPEPWTPRDTFLVARLVAWGVTHNWHQEASRLVLVLGAGLERGTAIFGVDPWPGSVSIPAVGGGGPLPPAVVPEIEEVLRGHGGTASPSGPVAGPIVWPSGASNAWVVGGGRSASGFPLLANDPHLTHTVPSLMFVQHIAAPGLDAIGATVPGLAYLLSGHNDRVAWGITSTVADTVDLCVERPDPSDPSKVLGPRGPEPIRDEQVTLRVRDGSRMRTRTFPLRRTRNGPAFNDAYPGLLPPGAPLVTIRWDVGSLSSGIETLARANRARSVPELIEAMSGWVAPVQTVTAADVEGRVAVFAAGRVPVRRHHSGAFPVPGWDSRYDWDGFIPSQDMPRAVGGRDDVFVHANNLMTDPRAPSFLQVDSAPSYRHDRIRALLDATDRHTPQTMSAIQKDVVLLRARLLVPRMLEDLEGPWGGAEGAGAARDDLLRQAAEVLRGWDFAATADSPAAAVFFATYREAALLALGDEVGGAALRFVLSQRYTTNAVDAWFLDPRHPVWDHRETPGVEVRRDIVREAFRRAIAGLARDQGAVPRAWRWGRLHDREVRHPFGGREALRGLVNLPAAEAAGGLDSVWKSHFDLGDPDHPFRVMAGPVWRMIVDLADPDHARFVLDTGESGWPGSPHYRDLHELWARGETATLVRDWNEVQKTAVGTWTLQPSRR